MSVEELLDKATDAASKEVDEHSEEWVLKGLAEANGLVSKQLTTGTLEHSLATAGLKVLDGKQTTIATAGKVWTLEVLARFGAGRLKPEDLELLSHATYAERRAAHQAATVAAHADYLARLEARREILRVAQEVGAAAIRAAIPFLLAAL